MAVPRLTPRELDVMSILWRLESGTVTEVQRQLSDRLAYTTVLWVLQTLEEKGYVRHEKEGRAYRYIPVMEREDAGESALSRLLDKVFHGSAAMLVAQLVNERQIPPEELRQIREMLDNRLPEDDT
jgi:BlaI family penicillinase repressor